MGLRRVAARRSPWPNGVVGGVDITVGDLDTNAYDVSIQVLDQNLANIGQQVRLEWWISSTADGLTLASALTGGVTDGGDGMVFQQTTGRLGFLVTEEDGHSDLILTDSGNPKVWLCLKLPDGTTAISDPINFNEASV